MFILSVFYCTVRIQYRYYIRQLKAFRDFWFCVMMPTQYTADGLLLPPPWRFCFCFCLSAGQVIKSSTNFDIFWMSRMYDWQTTD